MHACMQPAAYHESTQRSRILKKLSSADTVGILTMSIQSLTAIVVLRTYACHTYGCNYSYPTDISKLGCPCPSYKIVGLLLYGTRFFLKKSQSNTRCATTSQSDENQYVRLLIRTTHGIASTLPPKPQLEDERNLLPIQADLIQQATQTRAFTGGITMIILRLSTLVGSWIYINIRH